MSNFERRLSALEAGTTDPLLVASVYAREPDVTEWLFSDRGTPAEKSAVYGDILSAVDGLGRGLPNYIGAGA